MRIHVRELLKFTKTTQLWNLLASVRPEDQWFKEPFEVEFDTGEVIVTTHRYTILSSYCWNILRLYPNTVIKPTHHIHVTLNGKRFTTTSHLKLLETIVWDTYDTYIPHKDHYLLLDHLTKLMYEITNELDCEVNKRTRAWISSTDALDLVAFLRDSQIMALRREAVDNRRKIPKVDKQIRALVASAPRFKGNPLQNAWNAGLVKQYQVMQCIGFCGEMTDIDGHYFHRLPIMRNYGEGLRTGYDSAVESRFTAKALDATSEQIKNTEYFNRRLQLLCQILRNVHHGDCGTTKTIEYYIRENSVHTLDGMNYIDNDGQLKYVRKTDVHLEKTKIRMRVPHHCAHKDNYGICSVCLGRSSETLPANTNVGHMYATYLARLLSQAVLSTKHAASDMQGSAYDPPEYARSYIDTTPDNTGIFLLPRLKTMSPKMFISKKEAENLPDIFNIEDIDEISLTRITELTEVMLFLTVDGKETQIPISVSHHKSRSSLSHEFLKFLKQNKWDVFNNNTYCVDLSSWCWDEEEPIFILPRMQTNMADVADNIEKHIESNAKEKSFRSNSQYTPDMHLCKLIDVINEQLDVNVAAVAVIAYCTMIRSDEAKDFSLPKPWTGAEVSIKSDIFTYRSFGTLLPFERVTKQISNPESFTHKVRPDSPFDMIFMPEAVKAARLL